MNFVDPTGFAESDLHTERPDDPMDEVEVTDSRISRGFNLEFMGLVELGNGGIYGISYDPVKGLLGITRYEVDKDFDTRTRRWVKKYKQASTTIVAILGFGESESTTDSNAYLAGGAGNDNLDNSAANVGMPNTPQELAMLRDGNAIGYYESRLSRGDAYASLALDVVRNQGKLGTAANVWLFLMAAAFLPGEEIDVQSIHIGLANAHATAVDTDTWGVRGLLSSGQISRYHESFFTRQGLPAATFGGSFFFGMRTDFWCNACDSGP